MNDAMNTEDIAVLRPTTRTARLRTVSQAMALFIAPWGFVLANAGDAWTNTRTGLDDLSAKGSLEISAAYPSIDKWSTFAAMLGCLLLIPAVLGAMTMTRERAARLGLIGGTMMIAGYVCYYGLCFQGYATVAMAQHGGSTADHVAVLELTQKQAFYIVPAVIFVLGNIVGTFLFGLALIRARRIPIWAGVCILAWPVLHILGGPWGEVIGAIVEAIGLAVTGIHLLRPTDAANSARPRVHGSPAAV